MFSVFIRQLLLVTTTQAKLTESANQKADFFVATLFYAQTSVRKVTLGASEKDRKNKRMDNSIWQTRVGIRNSDRREDLIFLASEKHKHTSPTYTREMRR